MNQDLSIDIELSCFFDVEGTLFIVDSFEEIINVVVHSSYYIKLFFCSGRGYFVVINKVYGMWIKARETSLGGEFVGSGSCNSVGKFCER